MRPPVPVTLEGGGLRLTPLAAEHAADLHLAAQDDDIWRWVSVPRPVTPAQMHDYIQEANAQEGRIAFAVVVDGRAQGSTSYLDIDASLGALEIGWTWYARALWATQVNPTCKFLLLQHAFESLGAERVSLKTDVMNTRSQAAIRKLGARYDGTLRHHRRRTDGSARDTVFFSILADEWPAVRRGLEDRLR